MLLNAKRNLSSDSRTNNCRKSSTGKRKTDCFPNSQTQSEGAEQPRLPVSGDSADVCWQNRDLQTVSPASAQLTC